MRSSSRVLLWCLALLGCDPAAPGGGSGGAAPGGGGASGGVHSASGGTGLLSSGGDAASGSGGQSPAGGSGGAAPGGGGASGGSASGGTPSGGASGGTAGDPSCEAGVWTGQEPAHLTLSGNTFAHDPTMIKVGDTYYRFWTGDFIPMATSTNLTNWSNAPAVYDDEYPDWAITWLGGVPDETFNFPWAPDVSSFAGLIHLYSSFSAKFGDNISCISHLSTPDIDLTPFTDHGPVVCTEGNEAHNAIDAEVGFDENGAPWLAFGSFWDGIMAMELAADGSSLGGGLQNLAWAPEIEAPVLLRRCGYHYLLVSLGLCCPGEGRSVDDLSYRVVVGRSTSILGPYLDREGIAMTDGGGSLVVEGDGVTWAAAGHSDVLVDGDQIYHLYHAYRQSNGDAELRIVELYFDEDGWPVPHAP
jgi:arabinan endo-1,5-alpha-L-arabinosidase